MKRQSLAILALAAVIVFAFTVPLGGCRGRVSVNPGAVHEFTHEGPDGTVKERDFWGMQIFEIASDNPDGSSSLTAVASFLGRMVILGCAIIAAVIGLGFGLRWVFGRKSK
jgi:hypothetical protein